MARVIIPPNGPMTVRSLYHWIYNYLSTNIASGTLGVQYNIDGGEPNSVYNPPGNIDGGTP